jgi:pimeloyl-ACP methyl ester carboxylesterase
MPSFTTPRNTRLRYARTGAGGPLVCVPGGPLLPPAYLGTLGGLDRYAELVLPEPPEAETPDDGTYRCDRLAADLEALRRRLGLERLDLLGHSAGANIVLRYAERYPGSVGRLLLVAPSTRAVGIAITDEARSAVARSRAGEPWYPAAAASLARIQAGTAADGDWAAIAPFSFGRWDGNAAAYNEAMEASIDPAAAAAFGAAGAFDPPATRAVLAALDVPVTVIAGAADVGLPLGAMEELAGLFPSAGLAVLENAGHFPWVDEPAAFVAAARRALAR